MAWTAPMTAVANSAFTAAQFNLNVRDDLNETAPAKATTDGRLIVTSGLNSIAERVISSANVQTDQTTGSTSYTDLTTTGPAVTATTGTMALVFWSAYQYNSSTSARSFMAVAVSGATTVAAADSTALGAESEPAGQVKQHGIMHLLTGLTAGSNTFTAKYRAESGTAGHRRRYLGVIAL